VRFCCPIFIQHAHRGGSGLRVVSATKKSSKSSPRTFFNKREPGLRGPRFSFWVAGPGLEPATSGLAARRAMVRKGSRRSTRSATLIPTWCAGPQNRSSPGYEPSSCRASLKPQFHPFEGASRASAQLCLTRLVPESDRKGTSTVRPLSSTPRYC